MADALKAPIRDVYSKLRALRGKVRFDLDLKELREDRLWSGKPGAACNPRARCGN